MSFGSRWGLRLWVRWAEHTHLKWVHCWWAGEEDEDVYNIVNFTNKKTMLTFVWLPFTYAPSCPMGRANYAVGRAYIIVMEQFLLLKVIKSTIVPRIKTGLEPHHHASPSHIKCRQNVYVWISIRWQISLVEINN